MKFTLAGMANPVLTKARSVFQALVLTEPRKLDNTSLP
jgi:hypothetical protein